jgi:GTPase SAR1 family protein
LGYDIHGKPWYWPDKVRVMQGIVLGMTGSGKTTLLKNIITQDLARVVRTPNDPHRLPMVIFDGKGDLEFFYDLLPHVQRAGRLHQLRVLNPARPDISVRCNPFYCSDEDYMSVVNYVGEWIPCRCGAVSGDAITSKESWADLELQPIPGNHDERRFDQFALKLLF